MSNFDEQLNKELEKLKKKKKQNTVTVKTSQPKTFDSQLNDELLHLKKYGTNTGKDTGEYEDRQTIEYIAPAKKERSHAWDRPEGSTSSGSSVFDIATNQQKYSKMSSDLDMASEISKKILAIDNRSKYGALAQDDAYWNKEREKLQKELDSLVNGYGGLNNLRTQTQTLGQQLKLAQYQQKGSQLASAVDFNSKEFSKYAKEDKTVNDDLYEFVNNRNNAQAVKFNPAQHYHNAQPIQTTPYGASASAPVVPETNTEAVRNQYAGKGYHLLTEEEKSVFNYYWAKEGKEKAVEWLDSLQWELNERMASQNVENIGDSFAKKILYGAQTGFNQFTSGLDSAANALTGKDEFQVPNVTQITSSLLRENMTGAGKVAYDLTTSTANMLPSILASSVANFIVPGSGAVVGAATMGTSAGGNAYQDMINKGYDASQAKAYGLLIGGSESVLQYALGGITKLGGGSGGAFESLIGKALPSIENGLARFALQYGGKMLDEGLEEGIQEVLDPIFQRMVGNPDAEVDWGEVVYSTLLGTLSAGVLESTSVPGAVKAYKNGIDPVTGLSANDKKVVDKVYKDMVAEEEKSGKVTQKRKDEIYDGLIEQLDRGEISIETIEEVLGGENYTAYQDLVKQDNEALAELAELYEGDELKQKAEEFINNSKRNELAKTLSESVYDMVKDTRLGESYRDRARRGQLFQADTTKYDEKQRVTIQRAIDSGVLNNTNRTHDMVDFIAKVSADTGVLFDFTNNAKLKDSIFAVNGKTVDGYITKDGITINVNSPRYINTIVGHEITHAFEGTKQYEVLEKALFEYAKEKGTYKDVLKEVYEMYHGEEGYEGYDGLKKIKKEAVANLVGDYLFTDKNFVNHLSAKHQNIFQKVWNEIKYMVKIARAGSDEAKKLLEVQKAFEEAYRNGGKTVAETKHSLSPVEAVQPKSEVWHRTATTEEAMAKFPNMWNVAAEESEVRNPTQIRTTVKTYRNIYDILKSEGFNGTILDASSGLGDGTKAGVEEYGFNVEDIEPYPDKGYNPKYQDYSTLDKKYDVIISNAVLNVLPQDQRDALVVKMGELLNEGGRMFINVRGKDVESLAKTGKNIHLGKMEWIETVKGSYQKGFTTDELKAYLEDALGEGYTVDKTNKFGGVSVVVTKDGGVKYSLSKDSDGKQLTNEQIEYFKDSKMRDADGNLKVMYHGTSSGGFHTFQHGYSDDDTSFFFVDNNGVASTYSGTTERYEAQTLRTAEDFNKFFAEIGATEYEVTETDGKFTLLEDGDEIATSDTADGIYEEFRDWSGKGYGAVNYKVYLNLKNPLEVDADGREWNALPNVSGEATQYEYIKMLEVGDDGKVTIEYSMVGDSAPVTERVDLYEKFESGLADTLSNLAPGESVDGVYANPSTTRDYAQYAKKNGYDGVIFNNIYDIGGWGGSHRKSTVAIAFDSNQIKSVANAKPTADPDIRYSLSAEQKEYFKDSVVRDENGNLKVMYHGTPNGDYTIFKDGTYFTDNKEYADRYQNPGASSIRTGKVASNPKTFAVYLDIKKPFDIKDAEARRIYIDDYIKGGNAMGINPYLSDAEYAKIKTIDWTEGEDLREFLIDNGYDYDGLVLDEGADGGYGDEVKSRGTSYVIFKPEQAKNIDNVKPTVDKDIRFSLSKAVDGTNDFNSLSYAEIAEEQQKLYQKERSLSERKREVTNNPELLQAMDDVSSVFTEVRGLLSKKRNGTATQAELDRIEELKELKEERIQRVADLQESLGLNAISKEEAEIRETKEALRVASDVAWEREGAEKENIAIEKSGMSAPDYFRKKALKSFKTTANFNEAGYLLPDGKLLNFSGGERNHRYRDHREIGEIYEATNGVKALNRFMRDGNIRIMAESPGIDITSGVEPTNEQYAALRRFIKSNGVDDGRFFVDFSDADGRNVGKYSYQGRIFADRIINDIKYFYQTGKVRESSGLTDFLSLSNNNIQPTKQGNWHISGKDVAYEDIAPVAQTMAETKKPVSQTKFVADEPAEELFPDDREELTNLLSYQFEIRGALESAVAVGDTNTMSMLTQEYEDVTARIRELEAQEAERINSIGDADAPMEMDNQYPSESNPATVENPFEDRDWYNVGNQKIKAYMYENPEVKPFFQDEALALMTELRDTTKGEKFYSEEAFMIGGNEEAWTGVKRHTSKSIETLLDSWRMSYADIEKGLNAIIEDNGAENIAAAKKIEFMLNDRLLNGYSDFYSNSFVPPNQDYINLLEEMQINEYSEEAFARFMETADQYAPPADDIAPVVPAKTAPVKEEYLAVTPKRKKEPKMVRVDAPFAQKTANILAEEPKVQKKKNSLWSMIKENVLDNGMVFEDLALKTKNRDLQAKWNFIRYSQSRAQKLIGDGADGVKSLNAIRKEVESSGKTQKFYEYLYHWLNVDRMTLEERYEDTPNKAVFGDSVTADMSRVAAVQLGKENPEFRKWARDVYLYNKHLRNLMVEQGVISQETADLWAEMYPHYVPIRRIDDAGLNINVPLDTGRTGVNAPIKRATGGNSDILPLFDTMAQRTLQTYKAIAKNSFGVELKNTLGTTITKEKTDVDGVIDSMDNHEGLLQEGKNGRKPTFTVFENGEKVTFEITDEMYNAMKPASDLMSYTNPVANTISNVHRGLLTEYNPVFMATNAIKDTQDILINSQHPVKTYANLPRATWELAKNGKWFREYMENGGEDNSYFDSDTNSFDTEEKGVRKLLGIPPLSWISKANNFIERTPRLAEYITSREAGRSIEVSMLDAARVTTNFAAGGKLTKFANRNGATFLNASVQGAVQQARNIREAKANGLKGWAQLAGKFALAGLPAVLLNGLMWDDDDDYEELSDYVKQNYYIVGKYGDGKFVRIPKGRTLAVIQNAIEQVVNAATGNDEVDLKSFLELAISNLAPNNPIENNILAPVIQVAKNETWYGEDLVPTRLQDLPASEQFDESTDAISKWLGEKLNFSPYKINYLLDQYSGGIGDTVLPMLTPEAESGDNSLIGNMIAPLKSKFTTDSVMNNQKVSDFYDTKDELTTNAKASTATDEDILMNKYMNSINAELSELYAKKREIQNSNYSDSLKYSMVRNVQKQIVDLTREGLDTYKGVSINGEYATVGDRYFKKNEEGEWQKMTDEQVTKHKVTSSAGDSPYATDGKNHYRFYVKEGETDGEWRKLTDEQLEKQNEVTKGLGISAADYWGKKEEYDYAYEHPESYAVAKAVGGYDSYKGYSDALYDIKADKDENGKSINGSRKEKVIDYLNELDADYYTKIILFKNEYNADDTYNEEIVEYLDSRDDISYEEMVTILKKLGFTVSKDGTVTW